MLAAAVTGCASAAAPAPRSSPAAVTGLAGAPAPAKGTPEQQAEADAARMLTAFRPPSGARALSRSPVPSSPLSAGPQGSRPADDDAVTRSAWWLAPGGPQQLLSWEAAHIGGGDHRNGTGMNGPGVYNEFFELPAVAGLFDERELTVSATAAGRGQSAIRVDALVDWIPARAPGDAVPAAATAAVLTEVLASGNGKPPAVTTVTLTKAKEVSALAAYLNGLPANLPGAAYSCPGGTVGGHIIAVSFRARPDGPALAGARATFAGCSFLTFTMPGQKPAGIGGPDAGGDLVAEVDRVAGLHWKTW